MMNGSGLFISCLICIQPLSLEEMITRRDAERKAQEKVKYDFSWTDNIEILSLCF